MTETILVVNAGSSSIKFRLFAIGPGDQLEPELAGRLEGIGRQPHLLAKDAGGRIIVDASMASEDAGDVRAAMGWLETWLMARLEGVTSLAVGHRVVHGGPAFGRPVRVTPTILAALEALVPLAPLHQPANLAPIRSIASRYPTIPQIACFDTAFHHGHPAVADRFAIPEALHAEGVRRYGFHGLSYEYLTTRLADLDPALPAGRVIACHLGSGASMCAIRAGQSVDSTMGFTALDGLPMGTRTGQLDPGVILYLLQAKGMDAKALEHLLYHECGLLGLSGISSDLRDLEASEAPGARLAIDYLVYRIVREAGALAAAMGGLDALIFTAGIGERSALVRARVVQDLAWFGLDLDVAANEGHGPRITTAGSSRHAYVVPTDEELMIARHTLAEIRAAASPVAP